MYKVSYDDFESFATRVVFLFKGDGYEEAYDGYVFSGQIALEIMNSRGGSIYVSLDNIDKLVENIENGCEKVNLFYSDDTEFSPSDFSDRDVATNTILNKKEEMKNIGYLDFDLDNVVIVKREVTEDSCHFFWDPISDTSYSYSILFNEISISDNSVLDGFNFADYMEPTSEEYGKCHYCYKSGNNFDFYKVINPDCSSFQRVCGRCSDEIQEKCDKISKNNYIISRLVAGKV